MQNKTRKFQKISNTDNYKWVNQISNILRTMEHRSVSLLICVNANVNSWWNVHLKFSISDVYNQTF